MSRVKYRNPWGYSSCFLLICSSREWCTFMKKQAAVYIMANKRHGTLYVGVTSALRRRVWQHRNDELPGFTKRYAIHKLVYYELHGDMYTAIEREKRMKKWKRKYKINQIESLNPEWNDLWIDICVD